MGVEENNRPTRNFRGQLRKKKSYKEGEIVEAQWTDNNWYPARITGVNADGTHDVRWFEENDRPTRNFWGRLRKNARMKNTCWHYCAMHLDPATPSTGFCRKRCQTVSKDTWVVSSKAPIWDDSINAYTLDLNGCAEVPSVHNFQLASNMNGDGEIMLQLGKMKNGEFNIDFKHPLTKKQAFAIAVAVLNRSGRRD